MSGTREMFRDLNESEKMQVKLGDDKDIQVEGKGTVAIKTSHGKVKLLHNVQFVPNLAHNLLSVGQLMACGYAVTFDNEACVIKEKKSVKTMTTVHMTKNKMFPLNASNVEHFAFVARESNESKLWHMRNWHLNVNGLRLLNNKGMVSGLPKIEVFDLCEACVYGKQTRKSFPVEGAWRASKCLELIHDDLCGPMNTESFSGNRYFFLLTDDFSRMSWVYFLKNKSEALRISRNTKHLLRSKVGLA